LVKWLVQTWLRRILIEWLVSRLCRAGAWLGRSWNLLRFQASRSQTATGPASQLHYFLPQPLELLHDHAQLLLESLRSLGEIAAHSGSLSAKVGLIAPAVTHRLQGGDKVLFLAVAPNTQSRCFASRYCTNHADQFLRLFNDLTVDFHEHITGFQACCVGSGPSHDARHAHPRPIAGHNEHTQFASLSGSRLTGLPCVLPHLRAVRLRHALIRRSLILAGLIWLCLLRGIDGALLLSRKVLQLRILLGVADLPRL
jgi:hypothetical protein